MIIFSSLSSLQPRCRHFSKLHSNSRLGSPSRRSPRWRSGRVKLRFVYIFSNTLPTNTGTCPSDVSCTRALNYTSPTNDHTTPLYSSTHFSSDMTGTRPSRGRATSQFITRTGDVRCVGIPTWGAGEGDGAKYKEMHESLIIINTIGVMFCNLGSTRCSGASKFVFLMARGWHHFFSDKRRPSWFFSALFVVKYNSSIN